MNYLINYIDEPKLYKPDYSFSGQIGAESFTIVLRGLDPILDCRWHSTRQPNPELEWLTEYISTSGLTIQDLAKMTSLQKEIPSGLDENRVSHYLQNCQTLMGD